MKKTLSDGIISNDRVSMTLTRANGKVIETRIVDGAHELLTKFDGISVREVVTEKS